MKENHTARLFLGSFGTWRGLGRDDEGIEPSQVD
jgi:hypothetical protein